MNELFYENIRSVGVIGSALEADKKIDLMTLALEVSLESALAVDRRRTTELW
jgi:hypothetical protein